VVWGSQAENAAKHLSKGSKVFIEGKLQTRKWEADGQTHYKTEVVAARIIYLDSKGGASSGGGDTEMQPEETTDLEPF